MEIEKQNPLIPVEEAIDKVLELVSTLPSFNGLVEESSGLTLAEDYISALDLPLFDNSAMDGFCVRHKDLSNASPEGPVFLKCIGEIQAGSSPTQSLKENTCIRIFTGAAVPENATAVVMQEECIIKENSIGFTAKPKPWEYIRFSGEDVSKGTKIIRKGSIINARSIAVLRSLGATHIQTTQKPKIAIISTGDELVSPGQDRKPGQIFESNRHMLASMVQACGGIPILYPITMDSMSSTKDVLQKASSEADLLLTTGGISVGKYDLISDAWKEIGGSWITSRINMKPGKPFSLGKSSFSTLLALPGNPVSAAMTFTIFVFPAIRKLLGSAKLTPDKQKALAGIDIRSNNSRVEFQRVRIEHENQVMPFVQQGSHCLSALATSDGFIRVSPGEKIPKGQELDYTPWPY